MWSAILATSVALGQKLDMIIYLWTYIFGIGDDIYHYMLI